MFKRKIYISLFIFLFLLLSIVITSNAFDPSNSDIYEGIDVSQWQGDINFEEVSNDGIEIVYIKSSEGTSYIDPYFETNYTNAKEAGLKVGFYHYVVARNIIEAENEAQFFASVISGKSPDCKLAMDFESFGNLSTSEINQISRVFLERVEELTGKGMVIYSDVSNARNVFDSSLASTYPIWVAEYGVSNPSPTRWDTWVGFQFTNRGIVSGINGYVDRDRFTSDILLDDTSSVPENITRPESSIPDQTYVVKRGDTLSAIAIEFRTSVPTLVKLNNIANPNLIYPGQVLTIRAQSSNTEEINDLNHILYTVKPGDNLTRISRRYNVSISEIVDLNNIRNPNLIYVGEILIIKN